VRFRSHNSGWLFQQGAVRQLAIVLFVLATAQIANAQLRLTNTFRISHETGLRNSRSLNDAKSLQSTTSLIGSPLDQLLKDLINPVFSAAEELSFQDDFSKAEVTRAETGSLLGLNLLATLEPGEPRHANKPGGHSLWMTWQAPASGVATFTTLESLFDTVLAVYKGNELTALTPVAANDDDGGLLTSRVRFNAVAGEKYHIAVDGFGLAVGQTVLNWVLDTKAAVLPIISFLTPNQTVGEGETIALQVNVENRLVAYQWFFEGKPIQGATSSLLTIEKVDFNKVGSYTVRLMVDDLTVLSDRISVQINDTDGQVQRTSAAYDKIEESNTATAAPKSTSTASSTPKSASTAKSGSVSHGYSTTQTFSTVGGSKDPGEPNHCGETGGASQWYAWQSPTNGTVMITTDGSNFDTVLAVYIGPGDSYATLTNVACDNNSGANGLTSRVSFKTKAGTTYYIAVDGVNGAQGTVKLSIVVGSEPKIVAQPESKAVYFGGNTTLTVAAEASPAPRYQWSFNGTNIVGATNAALNLTGLSATNLGAYRVRITNSLGIVLSIPAELTQVKPLGIASGSMQNDGFHLSINCPPGTNYVLESTSNFSVWTQLTTNQSASGAFSFIDASALTNAHLFYRLRSEF
jgi:hypothetical protein